jgi:hypothetical protein
MIKKLSCDEIWFITRGGDKIKRVKKVTSLAPSPALYHEYINRWKRIQNLEAGGLSIRLDLKKN